jgi:hypothetical protein
MKNRIKTFQENSIRTPWHLWFIGLFFIFIYTYGIYDYFMMLGHNEAYYNSKRFGDTVLAYFTDYPILPLVFWTMNVFSGLIAPILLLFHTRWAAQVAMISSISMLCLEFITFTFMNRWNVLGPWISLFDIVILLMTFSLFLYCRVMVKRGVLK